MPQSKQSLRQLERKILARGEIGSREIEALGRELYADGKIGRREASFLLQLHQQVRHRTPDFDRFFFQAIKDHLLGDGAASEEAAWLRRLLFADGNVVEEVQSVPKAVEGTTGNLDERTPG